METLEGILEETIEGPLSPGDQLTHDNNAAAAVLAGSVASFTIGSLVGGAVGMALGSALGVWFGRRSAKKEHGT